MAKNLLLWIVIALVLMMVFNNFGPRAPMTQAVDYSQFISDVQQGRIQKAEIDEHTIHGTRQNGEHFITYDPGDPGLIRLIETQRRY
jgi:cell division protease FtsH